VGQKVWDGGRGRDGGQRVSPYAFLCRFMQALCLDLPPSAWPGGCVQVGTGLGAEYDGILLGDGMQSVDIVGL